MREIGINELKNIELEMLVAIDQICKDNNMRYFLCGGTLLGAVRHKGFIPWDDDIDIYMPRPDYEKLIIRLKGDIKYRLLCEYDADYYYNYGKLVDSRTVLHEEGVNPISNMGVFIDIFPLDGMPSDNEECINHFKILDKQRKRITLFSIEKPHFRKNLYCYFSNWIHYIENKRRNNLLEQEKYLDIAEKYTYDDSENIYATGGSYKTKDIFAKEWFSTGVGLMFEGREYRAPSAYDRLLKQYYGDYMELPPKEEQVTHHSFQAYWKD